MGQRAVGRAEPKPDTVYGALQQDVVLVPHADPPADGAERAGKVHGQVHQDYEGMWHHVDLFCF